MIFCGGAKRHYTLIEFRIAKETGRVDILVNSVWGGYERMVEDGTFTWTKPFWEQGLWRWDAMFSAGVRAHYHASQLAAKSMVVSQRGLIVNISFWAAQKHIANGLLRDEPNRIVDERLSIGEAQKTAEYINAGGTWTFWVLNAGTIFRVTASAKGMPKGTPV